MEEPANQRRHCREGFRGVLGGGGSVDERSGGWGPEVLGIWINGS